MIIIRRASILPVLFLLVMIAGFGLNAYSQDAGIKTDINDPFKDFKSTTNYMNSQGIDRSKIDWSPIDMMCMGLKSKTSEVQFNKCEYEKARDSLLHKADRSQCSVRAVASYPDSLKIPRTDTLSETDKDGKAHVFQRTMPPVSAAELEQSRIGSMVGCMQSLGWASAYDWKLGRRNICP
jgi:hypothetical protein